jgi:hypothetical protein
VGQAREFFLKDLNFVKKYQLASLLWLVSLVHSQSLVDIRTQTKNVDFSGASATIPAKSGTTLPATCNVGEMFFKTNNNPGQNLFSCAPANTWTQVAASTNGTVSTATGGQFGFYAGSGNTIIGHTLTASDIPALTYQSLLTFTGNGAKTASSAGTVLNNDCAKWDVNGNIIDAGGPCATISNGTAGQFGFYSTTGTTLSAHTLVAGDIPALNYQSPLSFTGSGTKTITSTAAGTANNCAKWDASGNVVDAGAPCGAGTGSTLSTPSSTTVGNIPQFSNATGSALSTGLGLVTSVGNPGLDTNVPSEKAIRSAIAAASVASGSLPAQTGLAGYLVSNGTTATWTDLVTGPSGALCAGVGCSGGTAGIVDIVTSVVPRLAAANTFTGVNKFQQLQVGLYTVATLPACNSSFEGQLEGVTDAASPAYLATVTGGGSVHVPVYCNGTSWVAH